MKITVNLSFVKDFLRINDKVKLETREVMKCAKEAYSVQQRSEYYKEHGSMPHLHDFTPETIKDSGINYVSCKYGDSEIYSCFVDLTYAQTAYLVAYFNHYNRTTNTAAIKKYAKEMLENDWRLGVMPIVISDSEHEHAILDGQHRLLAFLTFCHSILKAYPNLKKEDLPLFAVQINFNVPCRSQSKMDQGNKRTYKSQHNLLSRRNESIAQNDKIHSLASKIAEDDKVSEYESTGSKTVSEKDVQKTIEVFYDGLEMVDDNVKEYGDELKADGCKRNFTTINTAVVKFANKKPTSADLFHKTFLTGEVNKKFNKDADPALALRKFAIDNYLSSRGMTGQKTFHAVAALAIKNWVEDIPTRNIDQNDVTFKTPKGKLKINFPLDWDSI